MWYQFSYQNLIMKLTVLINVVGPQIAKHLDMPALSLSFFFSPLKVPLFSFLF